MWVRAVVGDGALHTSDSGVPAGNNGRSIMEGVNPSKSNLTKRGRCFLAQAEPRRSVDPMESESYDLVKQYLDINTYGII